MARSVRRLAILGSTGSIGRQALDVVRAFPDLFQVVALAAGQNVELLASQVREFHPWFISHTAEEASPAVTKCPRLSLEEMACHMEIDLVVIAAAGGAGLVPTLAAVRAGKRVALANKESLVTAGDIIMAEARRTGAEIMPVDSEHSAIWQCLRGESQPSARLVLTASGGPFRKSSLDELDSVTPEQALRHPSWQMGRKVTIDSATLMNKGLEVIEAHWLFGMPFEDIRIIVHPQSIVHSMVEFADGSVKAQMSNPDMRFPIQYALCYPERLPNPSLPALDWSTIKELTFEAPNFDLFPCLKLAIEAGKRGGTYPAVLCAADEVAVELFLSRRIKFTDIFRLVEAILSEHRATTHPAIEEIIAADAWARERAAAIAAEGSLC
ncbi:MAG: 1-deoxy-D-xylulose-5-phosphate reductoisomerase [Chloroflexi bacterium]|nr:1-deoxy-D-xylulose-5-phosphate reductoisomerase [Chloroflexota bacterium]